MAGVIVERKAYPSLVEPHFPHYIVEQSHDADPAVRIILLEFCKHCGGEVVSEIVTCILYNDINYNRLYNN